ncbi:uncharacterized protein LOC113207336 [Frankliniella occidentalis]|uniref:Uncharacterized protein LOC113207336 n=1 Tax=Frankliniella occidentalis TaxID=133901 RepID=A0A6J1SG14_FRAOC|nr:uncharacterized protein LOC113207336 [Frankliniella occidentalis]
MEPLADDLLVMVMQYLDGPALLACRRVCKRLAGLAVHRDVWRHRRLRYGDRSLCAALRLAPCLRELCLSLPLDGCAVRAAATACAVEELRLNIFLAQTGSLEAAFVIRNQAARGQLRHLTLVFDNDDEAECSWLLFSTVASLRKLQTLFVPRFPYDVDKPIFVPHSPVPAVSKPSLWRFECELSSESEPFVNFILAGHAATLEVVEISGVSSTFPQTTSLLTGMPRLRVLNCPLLPGMEALASSTLLHTANLVVISELRSAVQSAAEFLRRAKQLRFVILHVQDVDACVDLVQALASSEPEDSSTPSHVRSLALRACYSTTSLQQMFSSLASLPSLRKLRIEDLDAEDVPCCAHEWLHWDSLQTLMTSNRDLRLLMTCDVPKFCEDERCGSCELECTDTSECAGILKRVEVDRETDDDTDTEEGTVDEKSGVKKRV